MPYIIDGHNLIGKIPGLSLTDLDDEVALYNLLEDYFKSIRKKAVIYFDHGNVINKGQLKGAFVNAKFIKSPSSADEAIVLEIKRLKGNARNYTVISSDNWVINNVLSAGAHTIKSEEFASTIALRSNTGKTQKKPSENDTDYWLDIFKNNSKK